MPKASESAYLAKAKAEARKERIAQLNEAIKRQREACETTIPYDQSTVDNRGKPRPATPEETRIAEGKLQEYQRSLEKELSIPQLEEERAERARLREDEIDIAMERKMNAEREEAIEREAQRRLDNPPENVRVAGPEY